MKVYKELKERHRRVRESQGDHLSTRIHRALSWLHRAEQCADDIDGQFIFLWISFNAAYAQEICLEEMPAERRRFDSFIEHLCRLDGKGRLETLVWQEFSGTIRILLGNQYVFQPFWDFQNGKISEETWQAKFDRANATAKKALSRQDTARVLSTVLSRAYTLRNQIVHGGATWNSKINRDQVRDYSKFISCLLPIVIEILMDNPSEEWGNPCYPVVYM